MDWPVLRTGDPRTTPSVGRMAMARTIESPMCWATSHTMVEVSSPSVRSTSIAVLISGSWSGGKSTSMTGPITRATRPFALPPSFASAMCVSAPHSEAAAAAAACRKASAPPTISMISVVISVWRA